MTPVQINIATDLANQIAHSKNTRDYDHMAEIIERFFEVSGADQYTLWEVATALEKLALNPERTFPLP
jgi:hypothetical protein